MVSEMWGPRAHPERCDEGPKDEHKTLLDELREERAHDPELNRRVEAELLLFNKPHKSIEESLGTMFGICMLALIVAGVVLWWVR